MSEQSTILTGFRYTATTVSSILGTTLVTLDTSIANVALPDIQGAMSATPEQVTWMITSYLVASAIMLAPTGYLVTRFGRRAIYLSATLGFTISSLLCGLATSMPELVAFRILQGICGASLMPLSQAVLLDINTLENRGMALAWWGIGVMVGPVIGPVIGGYLTETFNWRWIFFINLPLGLLATAGLWFSLPDTARDRKREFRVLGFLYLSLALGACQLMLDRGQSKDWFDATEIIVEAVIAVFAFYLFLVDTVLGKRPFIDPTLFADRNFSLGIGYIFFIGAILTATTLLMPQFLEVTRGFSTLSTGLVLAPRGVGVMAGMLLGGRMFGRWDARLILLIGLALIALSMWQSARFNLDTSMSWFMIVGTIQGAGMGLASTQINVLSFVTLPPQNRTDGTSIFSLLRSFGGSVGAAICVVVLSRKIQINHAVLADHITPFSEALRQPWAPVLWDWRSLQGVAALDREVTNQARLISYLFDFRMLFFATLLTMPFAFLVREGRGAAIPVIAE